MSTQSRASDRTALATSQPVIPPPTTMTRSAVRNEWRRAQASARVCRTCTSGSPRAQAAGFVAPPPVAMTRPS